MPQANLPGAAASSRGTISRQLRGMIQGQDLSASELGRQAGVDPGVISRFLSGERDIRLETLDRLADVLGLRLIEGARGKARPPAKGGRRPGATPRAARPARSGATRGDDAGQASHGEDRAS